MKNSEKSNRRNSIGLAGMLFAACLCLLTACGEEQKPTKLEDMAHDMSSLDGSEGDGKQSKENLGADDEETLWDNGKQKETEVGVKEMSIPDGQILEQSFEVELDGWGKVTFAAFEPEETAGDNLSPYGDVRFMLFQENKVIFLHLWYVRLYRLNCRKADWIILHFL